MNDPIDRTVAGEDWNAWRQNVPSMLALLWRWIELRAADPGWYRDQIAILQSATAGDKPLNLLFKALGFAPRKLGKRDLALNADELECALALRSGFDPSRWSVDQAARVGLILSHANRLEDCAQFGALLDQLVAQGDIWEQIALYQGFALYPYHHALLVRAGEAIRSGMRPVFAAMALRNPWPQEMFDEAAWNQMIVKTFFLELPAWPVQGAGRRANAELSAVLLDLVEERQAAGRAINPELWRLVARSPGARGLRALREMMGNCGSKDVESGMLALACCESKDPSIRNLCAHLPNNGVPPAAMNWADLAQWQE